MGGWGVCDQCDNAAQVGFSSDYNLFYTPGTEARVGLWAGVQRLTLADWQTANGQDTHSLTGNPLFMDIDGADNVFGGPPVAEGSGEDDNFSLRAHSPAIDAGNANVAPVYDLLGRSRHDDPSTANTGIGDSGLTYYDIGAFEFQGDSSDTIPPRITGFLNIPANGGTTNSVFSTITFSFSEALDAISARSRANYRLVGSGIDGIFDTPDDVICPLNPIYSFGETNLALGLINGALRDGDYRLTVSGTRAIYDTAGNPLDGNGDGTGGDDYVHFFTIDRTNHEPVADPQVVSVSEDNVVLITLTASDLDADPLSFEITQNPLHGNLSGLDPVTHQVTYTPGANYSGADSFTFRVDDGKTGIGEAIVNLTVTAVNDAPVNTVPGPQAIVEDTVLVFSGANGNGISIADGDAGSSPVQVTLTASNGVLTLGGASGLTFITGDGTADPILVFSGAVAAINAGLEGLTFTPAGNYSGAANIQIITNDQGNTGAGGSQSDTDTVGITTMPVYDVGDYDGDGKTDIGVWRPGDGSWYIVSSYDGSISGQMWGLGVWEDVPVPGDYDGDGKTDIGVWRPGDGSWYIVSSYDGSISGRMWGLGALGDVPVPGDYDGDGKTDIAVWRPGDGSWYIVSSYDGSISGRMWGLGALGDVPVPGDYDGDGKTDIAVWRPGDGSWYIVSSYDGSISGRMWGLGALEDVPVPGDYDGDGKTDIAVWRPGDGSWYIVSSYDGSISGRMWGLGVWEDVPVPGDYDGDGKTDIGVWRPGDGSWYIVSSRDGSVSGQMWGLGALGDIPVVSPSRPAVDLLLAFGEPGRNEGMQRVLTSGELASLVEEARARWEGSSWVGDEELAVLGEVTFRIADLPGMVLGKTVGRTIWIDGDGAGYGWYIDSTPGGDREFQGERRILGGDFVSGDMDLLTVVMHEMGHVLGMEDIYEVGGRELMGAVLETGVRRNPWEGGAGDFDVDFQMEGSFRKLVAMGGSMGSELERFGEGARGLEGGSWLVDYLLKGGLGDGSRSFGVNEEIRIVLGDHAENPSSKLRRPFNRR